MTFKRFLVYWACTLAFLLLAAFCATRAQSQSIPPTTRCDVPWSWVAPTRHTDGRELKPGELVGYRILYGTAADTLDHTLEVAGGETLSAVLAGLECRTHYVRMIARTAIEDSDLTHVATISLSVSEVTAYKQTQAINGYTMKAVGTVALLTPCVPDHQVDGFFLLADRNVVVYPPRAIKPTSVFARCALQ